MRRRTFAFAVVAAVLVSSLITWFASSTIQSPAEIAAQAAPPIPAPILAPVEQRVLATKIVSRGTGHYGSTRQISLTPSALKDGASVVTTVPRSGARLEEGDVLLTVSGRPTFLLDGTQPTYRDLGPGMSGKDVRQLEQALRRLGFRPGSVDGYYDYATAGAVTALYRKQGFEPVVATTDQLAAAQPRESTLVRGARALGGTQVPSDELVFVPATPLQVVKVSAKPGSDSKGPLLTISNSIVSVEGALPVEQAGLIKTGADVFIDEPALGIKAEGRISRIATQPGTDGADGFHVAFSVSVPKSPPTLVGASVRLTVPIKSTKKTTLAVPVAALSLGADGVSRVQRSVGGVINPVQVEPGLSADGYVAVTPLDGDLAVGDLVVVGFNQ
jgi:peptidoglycan hydrolase-like protein with peptidoglycan-binding domain